MCVGVNIGRAREQPQNHGGNGKVTKINLLLATGGFPKQHRGRGTEAETRVLWNSVLARESPNLLFAPVSWGIHAGVVYHRALIFPAAGQESPGCSMGCL